MLSLEGNVLRCGKAIWGSLPCRRTSVQIMASVCWPLV